MFATHFYLVFSLLAPLLGFAGNYVEFRVYTDRLAGCYCAAANSTNPANLAVEKLVSDYLVITGESVCRFASTQLLFPLPGFLLGFFSS